MRGNNTRTNSGALLGAMGAFLLLSATPAHADQVLFSVDSPGICCNFITYGQTGDSRIGSHTTGSETQDLGPAYLDVGTGPTPSFMVPSMVIGRYDTYVVPTAKHYPGYPESERFYDYFNATGGFVKSNPYAPTGPVTVFPPTYTPTFTPVSYATQRFGSIMVTPGPNRFGGTMRTISKGFLKGLQRAVAGNYYFVLYQSPTMYPAPTPMVPQTLGKNGVGATLYAVHTKLTQNGEPLTGMSIAWGTGMPWTTGMVVIYQSEGFYTTTFTGTGYDKRNDAGTMGTLSLVVAGLTNNVFIPGAEGELPSFPFHSASLNRLTFHLLPEPGQALLLGAGVAALVALSLLRRR